MSEEIGEWTQLKYPWYLSVDGLVRHVSLTRGFIEQAVHPSQDKCCQNMKKQGENPEITRKPSPSSSHNCVVPLLILPTPFVILSSSHATASFLPNLYPHPRQACVCLSYIAKQDNKTQNLLIQKTPRASWIGLWLVFPFKTHLGQGYSRGFLEWLVSVEM